MSCVMDPRRIEDAYTDYESKHRRQVLEDEEIQTLTLHQKDVYKRWVAEKNRPHTARTNKVCDLCGLLIPIETQYTTKTVTSGNPLDGHYHIRNYAHYPDCPGGQL